MRAGVLHTPRVVVVTGLLGPIMGLALAGTPHRGFFENPRAQDPGCVSRRKKKVKSCLLIPVSRARAQGGGTAVRPGQRAEEGGVLSGKYK